MGKSVAKTDDVKLVHPDDESGVPGVSKDRMASAKARARRIRSLMKDIVERAGHMGDELREAHEVEDWKALGYLSWRSYVKTQFGMSPQQSYRLMDRSLVAEVIAKALGSVPADLVRSDVLSLRDTAVLKGSELAEFAGQIADQVSHSVTLRDAIDATVDAARKGREKAIDTTATVVPSTAKGTAKKGQGDEGGAGLDTRPSRGEAQDGAPAERPEEQPGAAIAPVEPTPEPRPAHEGEGDGEGPLPQQPDPAPSSHPYDPSHCGATGGGCGLPLRDHEPMPYFERRTIAPLDEQTPGELALSILDAVKVLWSASGAELAAALTESQRRHLAEKLTGAERARDVAQKVRRRHVVEAVSPKDCGHPPGRRMGKVCMACGSSIGK